MPNVIGMAFKNSIEIRKEKNVKERVNAINFARELESVYFDRSCQNEGFSHLNKQDLFLRVHYKHHDFFIDIHNKTQFMYITTTDFKRPYTSKIA